MSALRNPGRWQDAYLLRGGKSAVHLVADDAATVALCGKPVKPWTRPDPTSAVCPGCLKKAHRPHRDHIAQVHSINKRKGRMPGPGQSDIVSGKGVA